ncbi:hypothetical protein JCM19047_748 [Bacillus sp. JCM 19047]|nr:hypothetical protein JCM19047_748 [Bacillus sp. JCM 19047]
MFIVELKKLVQPSIFLVALLITIVFYNLELNFVHKGWPNAGAIQYYEQASDWQKRFGQNLDDENIAEIEADYKFLIEQADNIVVNHPIARELQLSNYAEFERWYEENLPAGAINELNEQEMEISQQLNAIQQSLVDHNNYSIDGQIAVLRTVFNSISQFNSPESFLNNTLFTEVERERLSKTLFHDEGWRNIVPPQLTMVFAAHFEGLLKVLIILMSLLIPSVFVRDRLIGIQKTQWSSHHGRRIRWTQFAVGMTASLMLITFIVGLFVSLLYTTDFNRYFSNGLNSFFTIREEPLMLSFYQWTMNQWIGRMVILIYLIGLAYSGILLLISQTSKHYLSLLMKIIPISFMFIMIANSVLKDAFYLKNDLYQWTNIPMVEVYASILLLIVCISLPIIFCLRQKEKDLVD